MEALRFMLSRVRGCVAEGPDYTADTAEATPLSFASLVKGWKLGLILSR